MPENENADFEAPNSTEGDVQQMVRDLQAALDGKGTYDKRRGLPPGYTIENGKVVPTSWWDQWGKGAVEFFGPALAEAFVPGLAGLTAPSGASAAGGLEAGLGAGAGGGSTSILSSILGSKAWEAVPALSDIFSKAGASDLQQGNTSDMIKLALQNAKVNAKKFAVAAPGERLATGERAALASVASPAQVHWGGPGSGLRGEVPTWTGGIKDIYAANQAPDMKALHDRVLHDSLVGQMQGGASGGNQDQDLGSAADVGQGSTAGDVLGGIGMGTSVLAALKKAGIFGKGPVPGTSAIPDGV